MQDSNNIWTAFSFRDSKQTSALELLSHFKRGLAEVTSGELNVDIEAIDAYIETPEPKLAMVYMFYIVAPKLGNYRKKILTVVEYNDTGRFPVEIINHFNNQKEKANEDDFLAKTGEILTNPLVKNSIENLYQLSKEQATLGEQTE